MEDQKFSFIKNLYNHKLDNGKSIIELTVYEDFCLWWTIDVLFSEFLENISKNNSNSNRLNDNKFLIHVMQNRNFIFNIYKIFGIYIELCYDLILFLIIRITFGVFKKNKHSYNNSNDDKKIYFVSQDRQWGFLKSNFESKNLKTDLFFHEIIQILLKHNFNMMGFYPIDFYPLRGLKVFIEKIKNWNVSYVPINYYWSFSSWNKQRKLLIKYKKVFDLIKNDTSLINVCDYNGKNLFNEIIDELELYFIFFFPHLVKYIEISREMIRKENLDLILLLNETFWWERSLLIATKLENVKTVAIQHGVISKNRRAYMYFKDEISMNESLRSNFCPIPNKTVVYGEYYKKLLTEISSYPEESVSVLGQPRYDNLSFDKKLYSIDKYLKKYKIPSNYKIILWTTQCHSLTFVENERTTHAIFKAIESLENIILIIKLHPADTLTHQKILNKISKSYNTNFLIVEKDSDTFEHLYCCDLLITKNSTTALEALLFDKVLIVLNLSGENDVIDYVEKNVALGVYKEEDLKYAMECLLKEDVLELSRKSYLKDHLYKFDGRSAFRISELIMKFASGVE